MATAFMVTEQRLMDAFASEMEVHGLQANRGGGSGSYAKDGVFVARFRTESAPVKGNKAKMEALKAGGYFVDMYVPYGWGRRRGFVVEVSRRVEITDADREVAR